MVFWCSNTFSWKHSSFCFYFAIRNFDLHISIVWEHWQTVIHRKASCFLLINNTLAPGKCCGSCVLSDETSALFKPRFQVSGAFFTNVLRRRGKIFLSKTALCHLGSFFHRSRILRHETFSSWKNAFTRRQKFRQINIYLVLQLKKLLYTNKQFLF